MGDERIMTNAKSHSLKTIREEFNEYDLEDGNVIRSKHVLITFGLTGDLRKNESGESVAKTFVSLKHVAGVIPFAKIDTSVLDLFTGQSLDKSVYIKKTQFKPKQIFLNIYETDEFLITVENIVSEIWQTKFKDGNDIPVYHVVSDAKLEAKPKQNGIIKDSK